jgi:lipopolysaccharide transport system ATP-binding protein
MTAPAIEVRGVSKRYRRGLYSVTTLRDELAAMFDGSGGDSNQPFHALRDVNFEVPKGSILGVVGPNGSGKTTLMKVLASITEPSEGEIVLRGRVGSLLEVGAGFDPELDGIENIFLNGAILGMSRAQTRAKLDQIVRFADIGAALDTPVKRYSSGMYVRLAFAVAAHLDAEILLVDEVLAVGDMEFQRKCLATMRDLASRGRTILFVSHNMSLVSQLCDRAMYLEDGRISAEGTVGAITEIYTTRLAANRRWTMQAGAGGVEASVLFRSPCGTACQRVEFEMDCSAVLKLSTDKPIDNANATITIRDEEGRLVSSLHTACEGLPPLHFDSSLELVFDVSPLRLLPGHYSAGFALTRRGSGELIAAAEAVLVFEVEASRKTRVAESYSRKQGVVRLAQGVTLGDTLGADAAPKSTLVV